MLGAGLRQRARAARGVRRAGLPAADLRAAGHRAHPRDGRADDRAWSTNGHAYPRPTARGTSTSTCGPGRRTASCPASGSTRWSRRADADPRGKRDPRDFALWKGHKPGEPETASWPTPWGAGRPGWHLECSAMVGKYLGAGVRHPRRRPRPASSRTTRTSWPSRARPARPFARYWMHNAMVNPAGEKMSKSLGNTTARLRGRQAGAAGRAALLPGRGALPLATSSSPRQALHEAASAYRRIEGFVRRAAEVLGERRASGGMLLRRVRRGDGRRPRRCRRRWPSLQRRCARATSCSPTGRRRAARQPAPPCARCSTCSASTRCGEPWASAPGRGGRPASRVVDALVAGRARAARRGAGPQGLRRGRRIRDRLAAAGVAVEDTPTAPVDAGALAATGSADGGQQPAARRASATPGSKKGATVGSGGQTAQGPAGKGPTPQGQERDKAAKPPARPAAGDGVAKQADGQAPRSRSRRDAQPPASSRARAADGGDAERPPHDRAREGTESSPGATRVVEALRAQVPATRAVRRRAASTRDDRVREALQARAERGIPLLEAPRAELDRLTGGAVHQGLALQVPPYEYAHPDDLLRRRPTAARRRCSWRWTA